MILDFTQKSIKSLDINIDLLKVNKTIKISSTVSFQDCIIKGDCEVGAFSYFGKKCELRNTKIGNYCSISAEVIINPFNHPTNYLSTSGFVFGDNGGFKNIESFQNIKVRLVNNHTQNNVSIGNDVWIERRAMIMGGVQVGNGAIIAANSVVTKDVPPYAVVGGVPAKIIKYRFDEKTINNIQNSKWFNYVLDKKVLGVLDYSSIEESLSIIKKAISNNKLIKIQKNIIIDRIRKNITVL